MAMHRLPLLLAAALVMAACAAAQDAAPASAAASTATSDLVCTVQIQISTAVFGCPTIDPSIGVPPGGFECPDSCKRARAAWAPGGWGFGAGGAEMRRGCAEVLRTGHPLTPPTCHFCAGCIDPDRQLELLTLERDLLSLPEYNETELINLQNALCALGSVLTPPLCCARWPAHHLVVPALNRTQRD